MFARLPDVVAADVAVTIDGVPFAARAGDTVAAALLAAGRLACRDDAGHGRAARTVLHDGRVLRLPRHDRRAARTSRRAIGCAVRTRGHAASSRRGRASRGQPRAVRAGRTERVDRRSTLRSSARAPPDSRRPRCAAERGLSVSLYDEQRGPGGQIYRGITASRARAARDSRRRLLARRVAGGAVRALRRALRARRDGVVDRARATTARSPSPSASVRRMRATTRTVRSARDDSRDRRAGATVSRSRLDVARRDDGGRARRSC